MSSLKFFERPQERRLIKKEEKIEKLEEKEKEEKKLKDFVKEISERLKGEGVPVTEDCRINMSAYDKIYSQKEIEKDKRLILAYEKEWYKGHSEEEIKQAKLKKLGEKLEMLKTAIFSKFLGEEFIVVRTSRYDDIKNHIDNVILEKETGNLVCALDEVIISSDRYEKKKKEVWEINKKEGGGHLKYGFRLEKDKEKRKLVLGEVTNLPLFYLGLTEDFLEKGIKEFFPLFKLKSYCEENLFKYFIIRLSDQVNSLKLEAKLNPTLKERLENFEKTLQRFKK